MAGPSAPSPLAVLAVALCLLCATEGATKWRSCSPKSAPVSVQDVEMSPDPPVSGHNFTLLLPARTRQQLDGGSVLVSIYYYGVPIRSQTENLCDKAHCPVAPGNVTFRHVQSLPSITPAGYYWVRLAAVDSSKTALFCTDVSLNIVRQAGQQPGGASGGDGARDGGALQTTASFCRKGFLGI